MFRFMSLTALASAWLFTTPAFWSHRPETALLALAVAVAGMFLSFLAVVRPGSRPALAAVGALLPLSSYFFPDTMATTVNHIVVGLCFVALGLFPDVRTVPAAVAAVSALPRDERLAA